MENQPAITVDEVKQELLQEYQKTVDGVGGGVTLDVSGERAFTKVLDHTVGKNPSAAEENWDQDQGFLREVTARLALRAVRYAKKENHPQKPNRVMYPHVIRAANCLIPDISRYCNIRERVPAAAPFQAQGIYCQDWDELPETEN